MNMNNGKILLKADNLTKVYHDGKQEFMAVDSANLDVREGEVVAILGPSGSGKTTFLSMLGCILKSTRGKLYIDGDDVTQLDETKLPFIRRRYIGFVFQSFNLFQNLTVLENVMVALQLKGINGNEAKRQAMELLTSVGLQDRSHFAPRDLSGGQKQRVSVARALAGSPPIILADEPTGNLDSKVGLHVVELLHDLAKQHHSAIVVVTHDNRITHFFDRILYIEDGILGEKVNEH